MFKQIPLTRIPFLFLSLFFALLVRQTYSQNVLDNSSKAVFIFDMAKYIDYGPGFSDSSVFKIGVLDDKSDLFWAMGNLSRTRNKIQDKPVQLVLFRSEDKITYTQILFVNKSSGFNINRIKTMIQGHQTMLMTEGFQFRESMINFVVVNGEPKYEANNDMIKKAGLKVDELFLGLAIKTQEDWEKLFVVTDADLQVQKQTVRQQQEEIDYQKAEILRQKTLLDSLDKEISAKEKTLVEKQIVLENQFVQINRREI